MNNLGDFILNLTLIIVTLWIVKRFLYLFFRKKKQNFITFFLWIIFGAFQAIIQYHNGSASLWTTLISIIIVFAISMNGYHKSGKVKFLYIVLLYVTWSLIEMLIFFSMRHVPIKIVDANMIGAVISKILTIIIINMAAVNWKNKKHENISISNYFTLLFIPFGSIYIATKEFFASEYKEKSFTSIITFSILLLINIIIFEIYSKLSENFMLEKEKAVYTQQLDIMSRSTEEQKKMMEEFHIEKHNLINQLVVIKYNIEHNDDDNAIANLNNIIHSYHLKENISNSGNRVLDAIINFKYVIAKEHEIKFHLKIFIPEVLPINQCDLGIILGNSLDNAIEVVQECKVHKKIIHIFIGIKKEALVIVIKNPYEHFLKRDKCGNLLSTKKDFHRHGYGIKSIKNIAEKYYGEVIVDGETTKNSFTLTVVLNLN